MSKAIQCDRCGVFSSIRHDGKTSLFTAVNWAQSYDVVSDDMKHLCAGCSSDYARFMAGARLETPRA